MYRRESLVFFLHKHDVIKIGSKQKGNVLCIVQPTMLQRSVCMLFDVRQLDTCNKLPVTFALFPVLCRGYTHAQLSSLYPLSSFTASHVRKNTRLSTPAQLQCSHSGVWEPGNKAIRIFSCEDTGYSHVPMLCVRRETAWHQLLLHAWPFLLYFCKNKDKVTKNVARLALQGVGLQKLLD